MAAAHGPALAKVMADATARSTRAAWRTTSSSVFKVGTAVVSAWLTFAIPPLLAGIGTFFLSQICCLSLLISMH